MKKPEDFAQVVGRVVQAYLDRVAAANMPLNKGADMVLVSHPTLYNWRKQLPDGNIPLNLLLNILEGSQVLDKAMESGRLPAKGRKDAADFVQDFLEDHNGTVRVVQSGLQDQ